MGKSSVIFFFKNSKVGTPRHVFLIALCGHWIHLNRLYRFSFTAVFLRGPVQCAKKSIVGLCLAVTAPRSQRG